MLLDFLHDSLRIRQDQRGSEEMKKKWKQKTKIFENVENRKQDREICSSMEISENDIIIYSKKE